MFPILAVADALSGEFRMRVDTLAAHGLSSGCVVSDTRGSQIELHQKVRNGELTLTW